MDRLTSAQVRDLMLAVGGIAITTGVLVVAGIGWALVVGGVLFIGAALLWALSVARAG